MPSAMRFLNALNTTWTDRSWETERAGSSDTNISTSSRGNTETRVHIKRIPRPVVNEIAPFDRRRGPICRKPISSASLAPAQPAACSYITTFAHQFPTHYPRTYAPTTSAIRTLSTLPGIRPGMRLSNVTVGCSHHEFSRTHICPHAHGFSCCVDGAASACRLSAFAHAEVWTACHQGA